MTHQIILVIFTSGTTSKASQQTHHILHSHAYPWDIEPGDTYYFGCDELFARHPDIVKRLIAEPGQRSQRGASPETLIAVDDDG